MGLFAVKTVRSPVDRARRLTIPELERYIRRGCVCSVCEFARAEIGVRWEEKSRAATSLVDVSAADSGWRRVSVEVTRRASRTLQQFRSALASFRAVWARNRGSASTEMPPTP
jgi:hypothetical protein